MRDKRILLVNTHGIGDVIMTLPMILSLGDSDFRVTMLVKSRVEADVVAILLRGHDIIVDFILFQAYAKKGVFGYLDLIRRIRSMSFTHILPTFSSNELRYNLLAFASGAPNRVGLGGKLSFLNNHNVLDCSGRHKVEKNNEIAIKAMGFWGVDNHYDGYASLPVFSPDVERQKLLIEKLGIFEEHKLVCLAPGSGVIEKHKRWPIQNYSKLAALLLTNGYQVAVIGGPGEERLGKSISDEIESVDKFFDMTGKLSLEDTLLLLNYADCVVANCNGVSHMAAAVQTPVVGIYGPTDPDLTGPFSDKFVPVYLNMNCRPCYRKGYIQGCGSPVCILDVSVLSVLSAVTSNCRE